MIAAHSLLQINRVTEQFSLALLLSHHGNRALSNPGELGTIIFNSPRFGQHALYI
jgi:hypothetical protein